MNEDEPQWTSRSCSVISLFASLRSLKALERSCLHMHGMRMYDVYFQGRRRGHRTGLIIEMKMSVGDLDDTQVISIYVR